jgi:hypothetical protein
VVHNLTLGFFDLQQALGGKLVVTRPLSADDVRAVALELERSHGVRADLGSFFQAETGVLRVPWLGGAADEHFAELVAKVAHELLGAAAADIRHGEVVLPRQKRR